MMIMPDANTKALVSNLSIMSLELRAGILIEKKQIDEAKKLYAQAAQEEKDLGYHEPPAYIRPVGETQAAALLSVSDFPAAKAAYQQALTERPNSGFPLYGLALTAEKSGDANTASAAYTTFLKSWPQAATQALPQITHAKSFVDGHTVPPPKIRREAAPARFKRSTQRHNRSDSRMNEPRYKLKQLPISRARRRGQHMPVGQSAHYRFTT